METIIFLGVVPVVIGAAVTAHLARRHEALWSAPRAIAGFTGSRPTAPIGPPARLGLAATLSVALGVLTLVIFAPLGLLLSAMLADGAGAGAGVGGVIAALALVALSLNGFGLGTGLLRAAGALYRRDRALLRIIGRRAIAHHGAVFALFAYLDPGLAALCVAPCAAGALLGLAYYRSAAW